MKKEIYEMAEMEIVAFDMPDVITTSGPRCEMYTAVYSETGCSDVMSTTMPRDCGWGGYFSMEDGGCSYKSLSDTSYDRCNHSYVLEIIVS